MDFNLSNIQAFDRATAVQLYVGTVREIEEEVVPALTAYAAFVNAYPKAKKLEGEFNRVLGSGGAWTERVAKVLSAHAEKASDVEDLISQIVPRKFESSDIDSRTVQLALYIENLSYFSKTTLQMLMGRMDFIGKTVGSKAAPCLSKGEQRDLDEGLVEYRSTVRMMEMHASKDLAKVIKAVPSYNVTQADMETVNAIYGEKATPLAKGFFSAKYNPFYRIRSFFNERVIKRYQVAKEQRQNLEFRIAVLQAELDDGGKNPQLERELDYHTGRLKRVVQEMREIEERSQ